MKASIRNNRETFHVDFKRKWKTSKSKFSFFLCNIAISAPCISSSFRSGTNDNKGENTLTFLNHLAHSLCQSYIIQHCCCLLSSLAATQLWVNLVNLNLLFLMHAVFECIIFSDDVRFATCIIVKTDQNWQSLVICRQSASYEPLQLLPNVASMLE